jgi:hypothetical protein
MDTTRIRQFSVSLGEVHIPVKLLEDPAGWISANTTQLQYAARDAPQGFSTEELASITDPTQVYPVSNCFYSFVHSIKAIPAFACVYFSACQTNSFP